ncbi:hypothetical protein GCM10007148_13870 [Parvularcula lutaonensis]|nr:hypothetical protein GCM10007148_13870 [Parvularcula lutaonensis]
MIAAFAQVAAGIAPQLFGVEGSVAEAVEPWLTPLVPAGWAFSIWGLLYLGCFGVAIWHAFRIADPVASRVGWFAILAFSGNTAFALYQPSAGPDLVSFVILEIVLVSSFLAAMTNRADPAPQASDRFVTGALLALAGWVTVATPAGLSTALNYAGVSSLTEPGSLPLLLILFGWAPVALALAWVARAWIYILPILWGIVGVAMRSIDATQFAIGSLALGTAFIGVTAMAKARAT